MEPKIVRQQRQTLLAELFYFGSCMKSVEICVAARRALARRSNPPHAGEIASLAGERSLATTRTLSIDEPLFFVFYLITGTAFGTATP
jgi:hypothetical protein